MRVLAVTLALAVTGCGMLADGGYVLTDRKRSTTTQESSPTGESFISREYQASIVDDVSLGRPVLQLACFDRTRAIDRQWDVTKTYRYRGGWEPSTYRTTALISGVSALIYGGIILGMCTSDEAPLKCSTLWAMTPFVVDVGYSLTRSAIVEPSKLIYRDESPERLAIGAAIASTPASCSGVQLAMGEARGPSAQTMLSQGDSGSRRYLDNATDVPLNADGTIDLYPLTAALAEWGKSSYSDLYVVDAAGVPTRVYADRCDLILKLRPLLTPEQRQWFGSDFDKGYAQMCDSYQSFQPTGVRATSAP